MQKRLPEFCVICGSAFDSRRVLRRTCNNARCVSAYLQHLRLGRATCTECGRPLSLAEESRSARSCQDSQCQVYSRLHAGIADAERCSVCRTPLAPNSIAEGVCKDSDCRAVYAWRSQNERAQQELEKYLEQRRVATEFRDECGAAAGIIEANEYFVTVIPLFANPLGRLPIERREEFRANITALVRQLGELLASNPDAIERLPSADDNETTKPASESERLAGAVCAACRGHCCRRGDTHAYLHVNILQRLLQTRPELRLEQLVAAYLGLLPEQSFVGSCVFHGEQGCTLPRAMRSDTCNQHFCTAQQDLAVAIERAAPPRAFVAIANGKEIVAARFVSVPGDAVNDPLERS